MLHRGGQLAALLRVTVLRPLTRADVELWESVVNDPATRAPFDRFGFATAGGMRHRVENRETITDTRGQGHGSTAQACSRPS